MNVYDLANERIKFVFENFDNVYVSFSGGKDSGVMLNLCLDYMRKNNITKKIGVFHIDYEAQYQMTTDYVDLVYKTNLDLIEPYRICLPLSAQCATSMHRDHWIPWDADAKDIWVREMPEESVNESNHDFDFFVKGMRDYEFQEKFIHWIHKKKNAKRTACLVGIRVDESLNRWRAIYSDKNTNKFDSKEWTLLMNDESTCINAYPIFDWKFDDVWIANGRFEWTYNKLYDIFYQAGVPNSKMRVASPFNDCGIGSLKLYKVIDPRNWGKMIGRTDGVNFSGLYGGTTAMGWRNIKLPKGHTWKSYMEFLISTLPKHTADNYRDKLEKSKKSWIVGGARDKNTIDQLMAIGANVIRTGKTNNRGRKNKEVLIIPEYLDDADIKDFKSIPTYKRMCVCIMKNDHLCKYMGFAQTKTETQLRAEAQVKYESL